MALELRFGTFAGGYDSARPDYPVEAIGWLLGDVQGPVAEVGAGTGKLTRTLVDAGLRVLAIEPDIAMLEVLRSRVPNAIPVQAVAEALPLLDASMGAVVAAQAWHWFDAGRAWDSAMRVLTPSGLLGVIWNAPSLRPSWQREVAGLGPLISPVNEGWWPRGVPQHAMEKRLLYWEELLTPRQLRDEYSTHLSVRKLGTIEGATYLDRVERMADREARSLGGGVVIYERLTWCARLLRA